MTGDVERRIRERAYEIWESEGQPEGRSDEHWQQARAEFSDASAEADAEAGAQKTDLPNVGTRTEASAAGVRGAGAEQAGSQEPAQKTAKVKTAAGGTSGKTSRAKPVDADASPKTKQPSTGRARATKPAGSSTRKKPDA